MPVPVTMFMVVTPVTVAKARVDEAVASLQGEPSLEGYWEAEGLMIWTRMSGGDVDGVLERLAELGLRMPWSDDPEVVVVDQVYGLDRQAPAWLDVEGEPFQQLTMSLVGPTAHRRVRP